MIDESVYAKSVRLGEHDIWTHGAPLLGSLDIELTERCNNNCIHCCINLPENDEHARELEMSTKQVKDILSRVAHAQARWLGWLGEDEKGWEVRDGKQRVSHRSSAIGGSRAVVNES